MKQKVLNQVERDFFNRRQFIYYIANLKPIVYNWFSTSNELESLKSKTGNFHVEVVIPSFRLYKGEYFFRFNLSDPRGKVLYQQIERVLTFEVLMQGVYNEWGLPDNTCKYIENCKVSIRNN